MQRPPVVLSLWALILMTKRQLVQWATVVLLLAFTTGIAFVTADIVTQHWYGYIGYESPYLVDFQPAETVSGPSRRVVMVVIDSLHERAYDHMTSWQEMKTIGSHWEMQAGLPSHSLPAWATLITGADSEVHGVVSGLHTAPLRADSIVSSAGRAGYEVLFAGCRRWEILLGGRFDSVNYLLLADLDDPGPTPDRASLEFILDELRARDEGLFILHLATLRQASLTAGVMRGPDLTRTYLSRVQEYDEMLMQLVDALDLARDTLILTVSHGTLAPRGAAGGREPEVLNVAAVMAGRGIIPGTGGTAHNRDIAPTVALLLGAEIPAHATGVPLLGAVDVDDEDRARISSAVMQAQHHMFASTLAEEDQALDHPGGPAPDQLREASSSLGENVRNLMALRVAEARGERLLYLVVPLAVAFLWFLLMWRGGNIRIPLLALALTLAVAYGLLLLMGARFSLTDLRDASLFPTWYRGLRSQGILAAAAVGMLSGLMIAKGGNYTLPRLFTGTLQSVITTVVAMMIPAGIYMYLYGTDIIWTLPPQSLWILNYATVVFAQSISQFAILALAMSWLGAVLTVNWWLD